MTTTELWDTDEVRKAAADAFRKWYEDPSSGLVDDAVGAAIAPIIARNARTKPVPDDPGQITCIQQRSGLLIHPDPIIVPGNDERAPSKYVTFPRYYAGRLRRLIRYDAIDSWRDTDGRWWDAKPQP